MHVAVIDTETTGFSPVKDHVVQFSGIEGFLSDDGTIDADNWVHIDFYIKSPVPMPEAAAAVNGITDELLAVKGCDPIAAVNSIQCFLEGNDYTAVIGHNVDFDVRMINGLFNQIYDDWDGETLYKHFAPTVTCDTLSLARRVVKGKKEDKPCALSNLIKYIGCDKDFGFHDSMEDVYATAEVYNWLVRNFT